MQNIIFLDFDGVLNNKKDGSSFYCMDNTTYRLSETNLKALDYILDNADAKIVLSTSWRNHELDFKYRYNGIYFKSPLKWFLEKYKHRLFWINSGQCPHIAKHNKRDDILGFLYTIQYVSSLTLNDIKFVVLDDQRNQDLDKFGENFYCTDVNTGLTMSDAESIVLRLNYREKEYAC